MASYFTVKLDTTKPAFNIYAPRYTTSDIENVIYVEAQEPLSSYQNFYILDNQNVKHYYTFYQEKPNLFVGRIRFNDIPEGIVKFYARVKDIVDNPSDIQFKTIEIGRGIPTLNLEADIMRREVATEERPHTETTVTKQKIGMAASITERQLTTETLPYEGDINQ